MAFTVNNAGSGGRRGRRFGGIPTNADINIVPLVDVVLVLLIIFMITANVMEFGLDIKVPEVKQVENHHARPSCCWYQPEWRVVAERNPDQYSFAGGCHPPALPQSNGGVCPSRQTDALGPHRAGGFRTRRSQVEVKMVTAPIDSSQRR